MRLNQLEAEVLKKFLQKVGGIAVECDELLSTIVVSSRDETGKGVFTEVEESRLLRIATDSESPTSGNIGAYLNGTIFVGFLFYIENGYIETIEAFTYGGEDWPRAFFG